MSNNLLLSKVEEVKRNPDTITLVSMAKRAKMPDCDLYVDVSSFMVDDFDYRLNGQELFIQNTIHGLHKDFLTGLATVILNMPVERGMLVVISCLAGERRSVATVELLATELRIKTNQRVKVYHRELSKWLKF